MPSSEEYADSIQSLSIQLLEAIKDKEYEEVDSILNGIEEDLGKIRIQNDPNLSDTI